MCCLAVFLVNCLATLRAEVARILTIYLSCYCRVLIDDREKYKQAWEDHGGTFILHTSTKTTLEELYSRGILERQEEATDESKPKSRSAELVDELDDRPDTP